MVPLTLIARLLLKRKCLLLAEVPAEQDYKPPIRHKKHSWQHSGTSYDYKNVLITYLANSASCLGSERSMPGIPPGGSFFPVIYSE